MVMSKELRLLVSYCVISIKSSVIEELRVKRLAVMTGQKIMF